MSQDHRDLYKARRPENVEENRAQRESDAPPDAGAGPEGELLRGGQPQAPRGPDENGVAADEDADEKLRKRQYRDGADLVSGMD